MSGSRTKDTDEGTDRVDYTWRGAVSAIPRIGFFPLLSEGLVSLLDLDQIKELKNANQRIARRPYTLCEKRRLFSSK